MALKSLNVLNTVRDHVVNTSIALRTRLVSTKAASDNVTQGTWIIVAVALAALIVGAIAIPGSPVHGWLHSLFDSITSISA